MTKIHKQAYEKVAASYLNWDYVTLKLLPECKRVTKLGKTYEYQKARKWFLRFIPYTSWVNKEYIVFYPEKTVEYYTCSSGENDE